MSAHQSPEELFWAHVLRSDGCWLWQGGTCRGYGTFGSRRLARSMGTEGHFFRAHRLAWIFTNGPVAAGLVVCHRCDNPRCVNPEHLFLGTQVDNMRDAVRKGRHRPPLVAGVAHPNAKLTVADVAEIRRRVGAGETHRSVGRAFGVSKTTVQFIANGRAWRSLPNPSLACPEVFACCA